MRALRRVEFDRRHQLSPYTVYRRLAAGEELLLVDLRDHRGPCPTALRHAIERPGGDWRPPANVDVVLFDQDGRRALSRARELVAKGHRRVRSLFGGLELWDLALGGLDESDLSDTSE